MSEQTMKESAAPDTPATAIPFTSLRPEMWVEAARGKKVFVKLPLVGPVDLPSGPHLVFYAGALALAAVEVVDWPVALLLIIGKGLADSERSEMVRSLGNAMEGA